jgi:hypothetical protein
MPHPTNDDCWFCRKPIADTAAPYELRLGTPATAIAVPRCTDCKRTQRRAMTLFFGTFFLGAVTAAAVVITSVLAGNPRHMGPSDVHAAKSGFALLLGVATVLGLVMYRVALAMGKTRGHGYALEHPAARQARRLETSGVRSAER